MTFYTFWCNKKSEAKPKHAPDKQGPEVFIQFQNNYLRLLSRTALIALIRKSPKIEAEKVWPSAKGGRVSEAEIDKPVPTKK